MHAVAEQSRYVREILNQTAKSVDQVTIEPSGKWSQHVKVVAPTRSNHHAVGLDDDEDLVEIKDTRTSHLRETDNVPSSTTNFTPPASSREPSSSIGPSKSASKKRTASAVIDLTLSDDDDEEPLAPRPAKRQQTSYNTPNSMLAAPSFP